jgi:hypothetical protein
MKTHEKSRDYKSFSSAAKPIFRPMANALGYEQITGIVYVKPRSGWYEIFTLQASSWGNPFFCISYGVCIPDLWPGQAEALKDAGMKLGRRLRYKDEGAFPCATKDEIKESAEYALEEYNNVAVPMFQALDLENICEHYFASTNLDKSRLGFHEWGHQLSAANYGFLLLKAGFKAEALAWLQEAERLMALPVFITKEGLVVHERKKFSRLEKPEQYELEQLEMIRQAIGELS